MTAENRKQRLHRLELMFMRSPIYFVTACTINRRHLLATTTIHESFVRFAKEGPTHGAWIGAYVLIPDHLHAFVAIDDERLSLSDWMKSLKNALSKTLRSRSIPTPTGRKRFSITCYGALNLALRSGNTFVRILCALTWSNDGKIGRFEAGSLHWNIGRSAKERRSQTAATEENYFGEAAADV